MKRIGGDSAVWLFLSLNNKRLMGKDGKLMNLDELQSAKDEDDKLLKALTEKGYKLVDEDSETMRFTMTVM